MIIEALKAFLIGIVEGITEGLPISSTGHMILVDEFVKLQVSDEFLALFLVVIQLGAIMAVLILYFHNLNPFPPQKAAVEKKSTWRPWGMVATGEKFVADPRFGEYLQKEFGALACEMEGGAIAHACLVNKIPCAVLRTISDNAHDSETVDFGTFAQGSAQKAQELLRKGLPRR